MATTTLTGCERVLAATWRVDPAAHLDSGTTEVAVLVTEAACSSGRPATGRIVSTVGYSSKAVTIDVRVRGLGGNQTCPRVETPFTVVLGEPLGDRSLVDRNASP